MRSAGEQATRAYVQLSSAKARLISLREAMESARVARDGIRKQHDRNQRTLVDLLDAERELVDAQINQVGGERDAVVAHYTLRSSLGQLTAENPASVCAT